MPAKPAFKSTFAILDVTAGRAALRKRIGGGEKIPVLIEGFIELAWAEDDGVSQEFSIDVTSVREATAS